MPAQRRSFILHSAENPLNRASRHPFILAGEQAIGKGGVFEFV